MADIEKLMGVSAIDIEKVMGVAAADVEKVMGLGLVTTPAWAGTRAIVFAGGTSGNLGTDVIQYKAFGSGDMSDFGDVANQKIVNHITTDINQLLMIKFSEK